MPMIVLFAVFGLLTGAVGVGYNKLVTGALAAADRLHRVPPTVRAAVLGAFVGLALSVSPFAVGGGDLLTQQLLTDSSAFLLPAVLGYFLIRFVTGPLSYAAGTPGGLFAPLLALGALWAVLFHSGAVLLPGVGPSPIPFALVGMAAFFAATVRAPFTGIVLIVEMTTIATLTVPMLAACFAATLAATLLRNPPVYDTLRRRMLG